MTYQQELCATGGETERDFQTSMAAIMTSLHVSAAAINAGGASHVVGDVITITHASAYHDLTLEVLTVSGGAILTFLILNGGAFANRLTTATATVGGSGYIVGDILEVQQGNGAGTKLAKYKVATLSGSAVATVTLFEDGGSFTSIPTGATATIGIGPAAFAGDDLCTLTPSSQAIIGTTAIAQSSTSGSGTGATFDLTLTATGWTSLYSKNDLSSDSREFDKSDVLIGTVSGGDTPIVGFLSYRNDSGGEKRWGLACFGMLAFNPAVALTAQPGVGPLAFVAATNSGSHLLITDRDDDSVDQLNPWAINVTPRMVTGWVRGNIDGEADSYHSFYAGLGNGFGPTETSPYPMVVAASSNDSNRRTSDLDSTGLSECYNPQSGEAGPVYYLRKSDLTWVGVANGDGSTVRKNEVMWPRGVMGEGGSGAILVEDDNYKMLSDGTIGSNIRANVSGKVFPSPGGTPIYNLLPLTIISSGGGGTNSVDTTVVTELDRVFFTGGVTDAGVVFTPEDLVEQNGVRYILIPCNTQSLSNRPYQFMAFRQD